MMAENDREVADAVRAALRSEPRLAANEHPIAVTCADGIVTLEGEAASVAAKKLALERAAAVPGVTGIVDRLRVEPAERMGDRQIRDLVRDALIQEPALAECTIRTWTGAAYEVQREPLSPRGTIDIRVDDGVVTLSGEVDGLAKKRLAGVLAWWVPGSRDVVNGLAVEPPEEDNYGEIADAVRLALEKDPFVDASEIRVVVREGEVTLQGVVPTESEREMAEADAWYVFAVDRVNNEIEVRP